MALPFHPTLCYRNLPRRGNVMACSRPLGVDAAGGVRCYARQFSTGKSERCARSLSMGFERHQRWRMVDRGKRRDLQDRQGKNRRSKCDVYSQGPRLGRHLQ